MKILYGIAPFHSMDVTDMCTGKKNGRIIFIPAGDCARAAIFTDPFPGIVKKIFVIFSDIHDIKEYDENTEFYIDLSDNSIHIFSSDIMNDTLNAIHNKLILRHGSLLDELPEQKMVIRALKGHEKVLELGSNIGRNSLVIASILQNSENLVTLESDPLTIERLRINRDSNNLNFHIENSALSVKKLIQQGWCTIPSETLLEGYKWVNTITFSDLQNKYKIIFDTLILDCEGAFYHILLDTPEILDNINLIIMENDYWEIANKIYIDDVLKSKDFNRVYVEAGGWGPCYNNFYEIWAK